MKLASLVVLLVVAGCRTAPAVRPAPPVIPAEVTERGETIYFGSTFPLQGAAAEPLFVYERRVEQRADGLLSTHITREPSGTIAVAESATHSAEYALATYTLHGNQLGQRGSITVERDQVTFRLVDGQGERTQVEHQRDAVVIGPTLVGFVLKQLPALHRAEPVNVRFAVLDRLETIGFTLSEVPAAEPGQTRVKMAASNFIYALAVAPIFFTFETASGKLVRLEGRVPPKQWKAEGWADLDARVEYRFVAAAYR